jgi:hypothetical protein
MRGWNRRLAGIGTLAAIVAMVSGCQDTQRETDAPPGHAAAAAEPEHNGKTLAEWIGRLKVEGARPSKLKLSESAAALIAIGPPAAEALFEVVKTRYPAGDETACVYAAEVLVEMGAAAIAAVEPGLRHESPFVRIDAAAILGQIHRHLGHASAQAASVDVLAAALEHNNPFVHELALIALDDFGPAAASAVPQIVHALDEPRLRYGAIVTLGNIGPAADAAIPDLEGAAAEQDLSIRQAAEVALAKIREDQ